LVASVTFRGMCRRNKGYLNRFVFILNTDADAARLAADARLLVERIWLSDFGNVKCIFVKP
jgi:hypothetical protein